MNKRPMRKKILLSTLFAGLVVIAVAAWTVQGVRYALRPGRRLVPAG